jgi:hypothetical protein
MINLGKPEDRELLYKGVFIALIGAGVLLFPQSMSASALRDMVSASSLVGWFGLVLGGGFILQYALRRRADDRKRSLDPK